MEISATEIPKTRGAVLREVGHLLRLGLPMAGSQLAFMLIGVVDAAMLGHVDASALAAAGIGNMWHWAFTSFAVGLVLGVEAIISQGFGRGDAGAVALGLQRGIVVALLGSIPVCVAQSLCEPGLLLLGQEPVVAEQAGLYCLLRLPSVPAFLIFIALRVYLQGRGLMWPTLWVGVICNVLNAIIGWALIFGRLGCPPMGLVGAGIAASITSMLLPGLLYLWLRFSGLFRGFERRWDAHSWSFAGLRQVLVLGIPSGVQMALEGWGFAVSMGIAGWLGVTALAAHQVTLNLAALLFMVPLGLSIGISARFGNLIGAADLRAARRTLNVGFGVTAVWACGAGVALYFCRGLIPTLFTDDAPVGELIVLSLPYVAAFQLFDATQAVGAGLLRAMGRPQAGAIINALGFFGCALPLAYFWGIKKNGGVPGIWAAFLVGLGLVALGVSVWSYWLGRRPLSELTVKPEDSTE